MTLTARKAALALATLGVLPGCYAQVPEDFSISIRFQDACEADDGEADGDTTTGGDTCIPELFADGNTIARLLIEVPPDTSKGKEVKVRTNLGVLDPSAADVPGKSDIVLTTLGEQELITDLFVGSVAGQGIVTVEAGGLADTAEFFVLPLTNAITITGPTEAFVADGHTLHDFTIAVDTETDKAQTLTITSSLGKLEPSKTGNAAFERTVSITRDQPLTIQLLAPSPAEAGITGYLRARFGSGPETEYQYSTVAPTDLLALALVDPPAEGWFADDETIVPIDVTLTSDLDDRRTVTIKTSRGILGVADDARQTEVMLRGGETARVQLLAGRDFGPVVVTAELADDGMTSVGFELQYSPPTILSLVAQESILSASNNATNLNAYFGRPVGAGRVSYGTRVELLACCDPDGDGQPTACDEYVDLPAFADAPNDKDQVQVSAALTPAGTIFVQAFGTPPVSDLLVTVHAYVFDPAASGSADCGLFVDGPVAGITALDSTVLALRQQQQ